MKKLWSIMGIVTAMLVSYFLLKEFLIYYGSRPVGANASSEVQVDEKKDVLAFIAGTHESLNGFLNYGKSERYTDGDWQVLRQWFAEADPELQAFPAKVGNPKLKRDVTRAYKLLQRGVTEGNMEYVIYGHRVYHDLDILVNQYKEETNIWGFTELGGGAEVKKLEALLQPKQ